MADTFTFYPEFMEYGVLNHGVSSVNNKTGDVVLYGSDILMSSTNSVTVNTFLTEATTLATNAEIDALFS